jgi:peroxidase
MTLIVLDLQSGGPYWPVAAGRFDGRVSNAAETLILPSPLFNVSQLTANFAAKNFSQIEMIALSGGHPSIHSLTWGLSS